jgi:farnesyl-diphosphate farnesyltransferase
VNQSADRLTATTTNPAVTGDLIGPLLRRVSRSFYLSVAVLSAEVRAPIAVAYLLARAADTIADTRLLERAQRIGHLRALRDELDESHPDRVAAILAAVGPGQGLPAERELLARVPECLGAYRALDAGDRPRVCALLGVLIEGMTEDLRVFPPQGERTLGALDARADLVRYTYLVAGCVGEFWTDIHMAHRPRLRNWDGPRMRALGVQLGQALQMTNVLRDAPVDLRQGRCYLPRQELAALGLSPGDLLDPGASAASRPLLVELMRLALHWYGAGWEYTLAIPPREPRLRLACAWPLLIGLATLERLARSERWLDPALIVKVPRSEVYRLIARSLASVWSNRTLGAVSRRALGRVAAVLEPAVPLNR